MKERIKLELDCYDLLNKLHINFDSIDHEAIFDAEKLKIVREILQVEVCKNLFLCNHQETKFYLLIMPYDKPFKTKELSHQINSSRLSFATPANLEKYLKVSPGSVNLLSLMYDKDNNVKLLIDEDLLKREYLGLHPNINTTSLKIKTSDILEKVLPSINHSPNIVKLIGK